MRWSRSVISHLHRVATIAVISGIAAVPAIAHGSAASAATLNPPALWMKLDGTPTSTEATYAAAHYRVVVLNPWETTTLHRIKAANPSVTVLAYKCLSSTRSYAGAVDNGQDAAILPTGVGYVEAGAHPDWFALSTTGARVQWGPYPGHWQMAVWNPGYQQRWASNVTNEIVANGWDGVMADNALTTLKWYSSATLAGAPTDTALRAGERALIATAGAALRAQGKVLVPNIGESRLYPGLWADWTSLAGGGQEESFAHMDNDPSTGFIGDWGSDGYTAQGGEMAGSGLNLAITRYLPGDLRSFRYGYSMFLVNGGGRGAFTATSDYGVQPLQPEQQWDPGAPVTGITRVGVAYARTFTNVFAVTNPNETQSVTVPVPAGATDATGKTVTSVTLAPFTGAVYKLSGATGTTTTTTKKNWRHYTAPVAQQPVVAAKAQAVSGTSAVAALSATTASTTAARAAATAHAAVTRVARAATARAADAAPVAAAARTTTTTIGANAAAPRAARPPAVTYRVAATTPLPASGPAGMPAADGLVLAIAALVAARRRCYAL